MPNGQQKRLKASLQPQPLGFYSLPDPFTRIARMPYPEIRANSSRIISQKIVKIQHASTSVSPTGSNHATIINEDTSHFFSDMSIDIANGDVWNSTADFACYSHRPASPGICFTAKSGIWRGGYTEEGSTITDSVMANGFSDFTSTTSDIAHMEAPQGNVSIQGKNPNTASLRVQPLIGAQSDKHGSIAESVSKSKVLDQIKQSSVATVFLETTIWQENTEEKKNVRTTVYRSGKFSHYISHASRTNHSNGSNSADLCAPITEEIGRSTEQPSIIALPANNGRFLQSRRQQFCEPYVELTNLKTSSKDPIQKSLDQGATSGIPTQTSTSLFFPWKTDNPVEKAFKKSLPFTAQGQVKPIRSSHNCVNIIDITGEEDQILGLIDDVNDRDHVFDVDTVQGSLRLAADKKQPRTRRRTDSVLGDSRSDRAGQADMKLDFDVGEKIFESDLRKIQRLLEQAQLQIIDFSAQDAELVAKANNANDSMKKLQEHLRELATENSKLAVKKYSAVKCILQLKEEISELENRISFLEKKKCNNTTIHEENSSNDSLQVYPMNTGREHDGTGRGRDIATLTAQKQDLEKKILSLGLKLQRGDETIKILSESTQQTKFKINSTRIASSTPTSLGGKENPKYKVLPPKISDANPTTNLEFDVGSPAAKVSHNNDESSCNDVQHHPIITDDTMNDTLGSRANTQYSSILGHGGLAKHRESVSNFWSLAKQADQEKPLNDMISTKRPQQSDIHDDTIQKNQSGSSFCTTSDCWPDSMSPGSLNGDDTECFRIGSRLSSLNNIYTRTGSCTSINVEGHTSSQDLVCRFEASPRPATVLSVASKTKGRSTLSSDTQDVLDEIREHKSKNCSICLRMMPSKATRKTVKRTVRVERPIPVSARAAVVSSHKYVDDHTTRPSVPPGCALVTVLRDLQDEIEHLSARFTETHKLYLEHDTARDFRVRKILSAKIQSLVKNIDTKKDQVYALYDVLERQKVAGQEMMEEFSDITWCDLRIDDTIFE